MHVKCTHSFVSTLLREITSTQWIKQISSHAHPRHVSLSFIMIISDTLCAPLPHLLATLIITEYIRLFTFHPKYLSSGL